MSTRHWVAARHWAVGGRGVVVCRRRRWAWDNKRCEPNEEERKESDEESEESEESIGEHWSEGAWKMGKCSTINVEIGTYLNKHSL